MSSPVLTAPSTPHQEIITHYYDQYIADADLVAIMGTQTATIDREEITKTPAERIFRVWADADALFPYIVHRIRSQTGPDDLTRPAVYFCDVWDYHSNSVRCDEIVRRIKAIVALNNCKGDTFSSLRIWSEQDGYIPSVEDNIWRYEMIWSMRYNDVQLISDVEIREGI